METFPMNPADLAVFAVLLLAALLAFTRGMVAEVLSMGAWIGAALGTLYGLPAAMPVAREFVKSDMLAYAASAVSLFVVILVVLSIIGTRISRGVQNSSLSAVDRSLGFVFGLAKGAVLVSVAYLFLMWLIPNENEQPGWLQTAKTRPFVHTGAGMLLTLVPADLRNDGLSRLDAAFDAARRANDAAGMLDRLTSPSPPAAKTDAQAVGKSYNNSETRSMNQLIQQSTRDAAPAK